MYVRGAKKREEVWLLDRLEELDVVDPAFRSRDYVVALDEETGEKAGFGRYRIHSAEEAEYCELAAIGTLESWRGQGVGAHVLERLVETARDKDFEEVYAFTETGGYLTQFGFEPVDEAALPSVLADRLAETRADEPDAVPLRLPVSQFSVPPRHRERFKTADSDGEDDEEREQPEDFGVDPDTATYKYDTGG